MLEANDQLPQASKQLQGANDRLQGINAPVQGINAPAQGANAPAQGGYERPPFDDPIERRLMAARITIKTLPGDAKLQELFAPYGYNKDECRHPWSFVLRPSSFVA